MNSTRFNFGGDYNYNLVLDRCIVAGNQGRFGVMRLNSSGSPAEGVDLPHVYATNCLFVSNKSIDRGTYAANKTFFGRGEFVNCTITGNRPATVSGSKLLFNMVNTTDCPNAKACNFVNTVISDNDNATTYDTSGGRGPISARNCIFPEAGDAAYTGKGDLVGPAIFRGTGTTPYALKKNSPGYGTGDASIWTKDDVDLRDALVRSPERLSDVLPFAYSSTNWIGDMKDWDGCGADAFDDIHQEAVLFDLRESRGPGMAIILY